MPGQGKIEAPQDTAEIEKAKGTLGEVEEKATQLTDVIVDNAAINPSGYKCL
jgi:hypothetical protein